MRDRSALVVDFKRELTTLVDEVDLERRRDGFRAALDAMARFWRYSPFNQHLIQWQRPEATLVAGRRTWAALGRKVVRGAREIQIFAPTRHGFPFVVVDVFDIGQTRGKPVPTLSLSLRGHTSALGRFEKAATRLGIVVEDLTDGHGVVGTSHGGTIRIEPGLPGRERLAVLLHELGHELLHQKADKATRKAESHAEMEAEAEAVSYVVLRALGLPSRASTYIAWQAGDGAMVMRSLNRIQRAARQILEAAGFRSVSPTARRAGDPAQANDARNDPQPRATS